jgi:hypothetical protein
VRRFRSLGFLGFLQFGGLRRRRTRATVDCRAPPRAFERSYAGPFDHPARAAAHQVLSPVTLRNVSGTVVCDLDPPGAIFPKVAPRCSPGDDVDLRIDLDGRSSGRPPRCLISTVSAASLSCNWTSNSPPDAPARASMPRNTIVMSGFTRGCAQRYMHRLIALVGQVTVRPIPAEGARQRTGLHPRAALT